MQYIAPEVPQQGCNTSLRTSFELHWSRSRILLRPRPLTSARCDKRSHAERANGSRLLHCLCASPITSTGHLAYFITHIFRSSQPVNWSRLQRRQTMKSLRVAQAPLGGDIMSELQEIDL